MLWMGIQMPPCSPNFRHRSVARSNKRHATPSYKIGAGCGNRTPFPWVATRGRNHVTTAVNPCCNWYDFGYSYPHHQAALSQYCDSSLFLKLSQYCDSSLFLKVRRVDHESSRRFLTRHDLDWQCRSWLSWLSCMPAGFCGLNPIRAGSCKKIGGQLGKVPNNLRRQAR